MSDFDLILRNAKVVFPKEIISTEVGIKKGKFVEFNKSIQGTFDHELNVENNLVLPGIIDSHVHFNEPGRTKWEGLESGSLSLAKGGGTSFFDMPLNSNPPVLNKENFDLKKIAALKKSYLDFGIWGGVTPQNLTNLEELANCGVIGFKAFMCDSGINEFQHSDVKTLKKAMHILKELNLPLAIHAESPKILNQTAKKIQQSKKNNKSQTNDIKEQIEFFLKSRPIKAENEAVKIACQLAGEIGCKLHIVHVSNTESAQLIYDAKISGVDVTAETCPHYLLLNDNDIFLKGVSAKCAPPLRNSENLKQMWEILKNDIDNQFEFIDTIGSDHSPSSLDLKNNNNFLNSWGGISGCQHGFILFLDKLLSLDDKSIIPKIINKLSKNVTKRFNIKNKGSIKINNDADFFILEVVDYSKISKNELSYKNKISPYVGEYLGLKVNSTYLRGSEISKQLTKPKILTPKIN